MPAKACFNIIEHMTYSIYLYIQRGLFERHKLTFALMLTNKIQVSAKALSLDLVNLFLKGGGSLDIKSAKKKPKDWIPDKCWLDIVALSQHSSFSDIVESINVNDKLWRQWYDKEAPEEARVPDFEDRVDAFERMCIVKALREDRTMVAAQTYIAKAIGERFVESVPLNMETTWAESTPYVPLICPCRRAPTPRSSSRSSPSARRSRRSRSWARAKKSSRASSCHRDADWTVGLTAEHAPRLGVHGGDRDVPAESREPARGFPSVDHRRAPPQFPIGLLQMSIKITNEALAGMRAGLRNSYNWVSQDMLDVWGSSSGASFVRDVLHALHRAGAAQVRSYRLERPYEFNQSDLSACVQFLQNHLTEMDAKKLASPPGPP